MIRRTPEMKESVNCTVKDSKSWQRSSCKFGHKCEFNHDQDKKKAVNAKDETDLEIVEMNKELYVIPFAVKLIWNIILKI